MVRQPSRWGGGAMIGSGTAGAGSCMPGGGGEGLGLGLGGPLPFLPPPPSRPADVLQYERALFTDAHSGEAGGGPVLGLGLGLGLSGATATGAAFLRPAALAAEQLPLRLRQQLQSWARRA